MSQPVLSHGIVAQGQAPRFKTAGKSKKTKGILILMLIRIDSPERTYRKNSCTEYSLPSGLGHKQLRTYSEARYSARMLQMLDATQADRGRLYMRPVVVQEGVLQQLHPGGQALCSLIQLCIRCPGPA
jgi:hypothetical protein